MFSAAAHAHAALRHADPAAGAVVEAPTAKLTLEFSTEVDQTAVELSLSDATGKEIELQSADATAKMSTLVTRAPKTPLAPGTYLVKWRVLSIDGHHTRGDYTFDVKAAN